MKWFIWGFIAAVTLFIAYKFGWQLTDWVNNLAANWGCRLGEMI